MKSHSYTYAFLSEQSGLVKIGKSSSPRDRINQIGPDLIPILCIKIDIEIYLHGVYSESRVFGEWFSLSIESIEWLKNHPGNLVTKSGDLPESLDRVTSGEFTIIKVGRETHTELKRAARDAKIGLVEFSCMAIERGLDNIMKPKTESAK